jgi:hypothetical protein
MANMTEKTRMAIEELKGIEFKEEDAKVTLRTLEKYVKVQRIPHYKYVKWELEDVVNFLNRCAGEDLYECDWHYEVINGEVFERIELEPTYRII